MGYDIEGLGRSNTGAVILNSPKLTGIVEPMTLTADRTVYLPEVAKSAGVMRIIKKLDATYTLTISGYGGTETIDGQTSIELSSQYEVARLYCDGIVWHLF